MRSIYIKILAIPVPSFGEILTSGGSLNIVSQNDSLELMRKLRGEALVDEVPAILKLPKPASESPYMVPRPPP
jgi:hypothetical protein